MSVKLFIGGLSWNTSDESLREKFAEYGTVEDAVVIRDRETGRSRGFGFVTYANNNEAEDAMKQMDEANFDGRTIKVNLASEREPRS
ncbi:21_t:CDS:2, partial [Ambispora leptoticha]